MKQGLQWEALTDEAARISAQKKDITAHTALLRVYTSELGELMDLGEHGMARMLPHAHRQLASLLKIPKPYYDRMLDRQPDLYTHTVNTWLSSADTEKRQFVRTLGDDVRAILSDGYLPFDYTDMLDTLDPLLSSYNGDLQVESSGITDVNMHIKMAFPRIYGEVRVGDVVQMGVLWRDSEVGAGSIVCHTFIKRLRCLNGLVVSEIVSSASRNHVGSRIIRSGAHEIVEYHDDLARLKAKEGIANRLRASAAEMLTQANLDSVVLRLRESADYSLDDVYGSVEVVAKQAGLTDAEAASVSSHMGDEMDGTIYGLINAITRSAADHSDYERATELEALGGKLLALPASEWKVIARGEASQVRGRRSESPLAMASY